MRDFSSLSEQEILALTISLEEEDERVYADFAVGLREKFPGSAAVFEGMRADESRHRRRLLELYRQKFGEHIPLIRRQDIRGFVKRNSVWLVQPLNLEKIRNQVRATEMETLRFYEKVAARAQDASIRQLLDDLVQEERLHYKRADELEKDKLTGSVRELEAEAGRKLFLLQIVQPGLVGLIDGSVSTMAPVFAAALATRSTRDAFLVGLGGVRRRGHQHGFRRGPFGRWESDRARPSVDSWSSLRSDDGRRRNRPHATFPDSQIHHSDGCGDDRRRIRVGNNLMGEAQVHGSVGIEGGAAGGRRRRTGVSSRPLDRQRVRAQGHHRNARGG